MALQRSVPAGVAHGAMPAQPGAAVPEGSVPPGASTGELITEPAPVVRDLRGRTGHAPYSLEFAAGDIVVVSGLPGGGKSTLIRQAVTGRAIDSQDTRDRWAAALPPYFPTPSTAPWSAPPTTSGSGPPCAPASPSSSTTAVRRPGYGAGSPGTPSAGAASFI